MEIVLPEEVISHVLSFLSLSDRKEASLVNRHWYAASLHPSLLRQTVVAIIPSMSTVDVIRTVFKRRTPNLVLDQIDSSFRSTQVVDDATQPLSDVLQSLTLKGCDITESVFMAFVQNCRSLTSLDISRCNSLFMSGQLLSKADDVRNLKDALQNVTHLGLAYNRHLSDVMLNRFLSVCPSVEHLNLCRNNFVIRSEMFKQGSSASISMLTYGNLETLLGEKCKQIKGLDLSRTSLNDDSLKSLAAVPGLALTDMTLIHCMDLTDDGIVGLVKRQTSLRRLNVSQLSGISDRAVQAISQNLRSLRELKLARCRSVTDRSVSSLHRLRSLRLLDLSSCDPVTSQGLLAGICGAEAPMTTITHLNLHAVHAVTDCFVVKLVRTLPELQFLSVSSSRITDVSVYFISKYLRKLKVLDLSWCKAITDSGLLGRELCVEEDCLHELAADCKCRRKSFGKDVLNLPKITDKQEQLDNWTDLRKQLGEDDSGHHQINDLRSLRELDLSSCHLITDESILAMNFPELRRLALTLCTGITDTTLCAAATNLPSLESLAVSHSSRVTDAGITTLAENATRLSALQISNCMEVTDAGLAALEKHAARRLTHLDVSGCSKVTGAMLDRMEANMPRLHSLTRRLIT